MLMRKKISKRDFPSVSVPERHAHYLPARLVEGKWDYDEVIAELAGADKLSPVYNDLCKHVLTGEEIS